MHLVSRWTPQRRVHEDGLREVTGYSTISDEQLDNIVERFTSDHGTLVGHSLISGHLRSVGLRVQRDRIRTSIGCIDPEFVGQSLLLEGRIRWHPQTVCVISMDITAWCREVCHSWRMDEFSRLIVFLKCSTNNRSVTGKVTARKGRNGRQGSAVIMGLKMLVCWI